MLEYHVYILNEDNRIKGRKDLFCRDDEAAKEMAVRMVDGHAIELWREACKIARFTPAS